MNIYEMVNFIRQTDETEDQKHLSAADNLMSLHLNEDINSESLFYALKGLMLGVLNAANYNPGHVKIIRSAVTYPSVIPKNMTCGCSVNVRVEKRHKKLFTEVEVVTDMNYCLQHHPARYEVEKILSESPVGPINE